MSQLHSTSSQEYEFRLKKLQDMNFQYPNTARYTHLSSELNRQLLEKDPQAMYCLAGRMMLKRDMGKAMFFQLQDSTGQLQCYARKNGPLGEELFETLTHLDLGDCLSVKGMLFITKTGELTLELHAFELAVKALRPLPDKYHGMSDPELIYRQRYLDLLTNQHSRSVFQFRSELIAFIRNFFIQRRYIEVETPMMHVIPGGANARPFMTHHHTLDIPLYLRIAPELFLKRLVVGGFERVFEINRNFRNEGISSRHNPEFTMIEFYQAYSDYTDMMNLTQDLFFAIAEKFPEKAQISLGDVTFSLKDPIPRLSLAETIARYGCFNIEKAQDVNFLRTALGKETSDSSSLGALQFAYFEEFVEHKITSPIFVCDYPIDVSPLARRNPQRPDMAERFELFVGGRELANGFSELNDPIDQASRFLAQAQAKESGDDEAMFFDQDYIDALEYGLPPTAGQGIGIDRLVMLLTGAASIKDVILFPTLKPKD